MGGLSLFELEVDDNVASSVLINLYRKNRRYTNAKFCDSMQQADVFTLSFSGSAWFVCLVALFQYVSRNSFAGILVS